MAMFQEIVDALAITSANVDVVKKRVEEALGGSGGSGDGATPAQLDILASSINDLNNKIISILAPPSNVRPFNDPRNPVDARGLRRA